MNHFPRPAADAPPGRPRALCREPCAAARRSPVPRGFFGHGKMHEPVAARSAPRCRTAASPVLALPLRPAAARAACAPAAAVGQLSRPGRRHIRSCPAGRVPRRLTAVPHSLVGSSLSKRWAHRRPSARPGPARPGPARGQESVSYPVRRRRPVPRARRARWPTGQHLGRSPRRCACRARAGWPVTAGRSTQTVLNPTTRRKKQARRMAGDTGASESWLRGCRGPDAAVCLRPIASRNLYLGRRDILGAGSIQSCLFIQSCLSNEGGPRASGPCDPCSGPEVPKIRIPSQPCHEPRDGRDPSLSRAPVPTLATPRPRRACGLCAPRFAEPARSARAARGVASLPRPLCSAAPYGR